MKTKHVCHVWCTDIIQSNLATWWFLWLWSCSVRKHLSGSINVVWYQVAITINVWLKMKSWEVSYELWYKQLRTLYESKICKGISEVIWYAVNQSAGTLPTVKCFIQRLRLSIVRETVTIGLSVDFLSEGIPFAVVLRYLAELLHTSVVYVAFLFTSFNLNKWSQMMHHSH